MSAEKLLVVAVVGVGAYLMMKKSAVAAPVGTVRAQPTQTQNVNNEMWSKLLGGAWRELMQANGGSGAGARPFIVRNPFTGLFNTSDGKPLYTGDGATDYMITNTGLYGDARDYTKETGNVVNDTAVDNFMKNLGFEF